MKSTEPSRRAKHYSTHSAPNLSPHKIIVRNGTMSIDWTNVPNLFSDDRKLMPTAPVLPQTEQKPTNQDNNIAVKGNCCFNINKKK